MLDATWEAEEKAQKGATDLSEAINQLKGTQF